MQNSLIKRLRFVWQYHCSYSLKKCWLCFRRRFIIQPVLYLTRRSYLLQRLFEIWRGCPPDFYYGEGVSPEEILELWRQNLWHQRHEIEARDRAEQLKR